MLTKESFSALVSQGPCLLDGATGSCLRAKGMPRDCATEEWVLRNPEVLVELQRGYAEAGSQIIYAPTFQAQPIALKKIGLEHHTEAINAQLIALSRSAAPGCLIAGDIATLAAFCDSWDPDNFDLLVENYRRQIRGLIDGGADLLVGETLLYPQEAEAILTAAELEGAQTTMISVSMQSGGFLYSGHDAGPLMEQLEQWGACAVGFNCVAADDMTAHLVSKLRRHTRLPLISKPNAGNPIINAEGLAEYKLEPEPFAQIQLDAFHNGAALLGGCCGTTPRHMKALKHLLEDCHE